MKKKIIIGFIIILIIIMLIPLPIYYKDGGSVEYHAILYSVMDKHAMVPGGTDTGIVVKVLGITVYDNVVVSPET